MDQAEVRADETKRSQNEVDASGEPKKKVRHRKKLLIDRIRLQLEFYFSAANLSKDQFMANLLSESPYIKLETFFKFNRVRALTEDVGLVQKAVNKSKILELSEDGLEVKRIGEVVRKENELECTIYVENIPSHVVHEWLHEIFSQYGTIDYISFPHFKSTGRPKGFAFIEFSTPDIAYKALQAYGAIGCKMSLNMEPSQLQSIRTFEDNAQMGGSSYESERYGRGDMKSMENINNENLGESKNADDDETVEKERNGKKKRKREDEGIIKSKKPKEGDDVFETEEFVEQLKSEKKKASEKKSGKKTVLESDDFVEKCESSKEGKKSKNKAVSELEKAIKKVRKEVDNEKEATADESKSTKTEKRKSLDETGNEEVKKSKKQKVIADSTGSASSTKVVEEQVMEADESSMRKVKKNKKKRKRNKKEKIESVEGASLKVMPKSEWLRLRNRYLNAQKQNMSNVKMDLHSRKYNENVKEGGYQQNTNNKSNFRMPNFTPNAILKISFEGPPQDSRKLQETIREGGRGGVAYVETSPGEKDVFVRFHSAEAASTYLKAGLWSRMTLLSGEEEKTYWDHCIEVWQKKRNNKRFNQNSSENRGKEKLLQRALREAGMRKPNAHLVFN